MKTTASILVASLVLNGIGLRAQPNTDTNKLAELRAKAEAGDAAAQCDLGEAYSINSLKFGLKWDWTNGMIWFKKAADQGNAEAECRFGTGCEFGIGGIREDRAEAVKWYRKSVEQDFPEAYWRLGYLYSWGGGMEKNETEAFKLFSKAAERNVFPAYACLGSCYYGGHGVHKDFVEAYKWVLLADSLGQYTEHLPGERTNFFKSRQAELTPDQIQEATRRADDWMKQHKLTPVKP